MAKRRRRRSRTRRRRHARAPGPSLLMLLALGCLIAAAAVGASATVPKLGLFERLAAGILSRRGPDKFMDAVAESNLALGLVVGGLMLGLWAAVRLIRR